MNLKKIGSAVVTGALAIVLGLGVQYAMAQWSAAPSNPPSDNVAAPVNVGSSYQAKSGGLALGTTTALAGTIFDANGVSWINGLIVQGAFEYAAGSPQQGEVLTATDSNGDATWQTAAAVTGTTSNTTTIGVAAPGTWWNTGTSTNMASTTCPVNYYMTGVVQAGGCSGGYCGLRPICNPL